MCQTLLKWSSERLKMEGTHKHKENEKRQKQTRSASKFGSYKSAYMKESQEAKQFAMHNLRKARVYGKTENRKFHCQSK